MTQPFFEALGLSDDADERAVKRAYARLLKQIDQAADPEGFQALREAYEAALQWQHMRAVGEPSTASDEEAPSPDHAEPGQAQPPGTDDPAPHADVIEVVNSFMAGLDKHEGDKASMLQGLAACLEDARLQGLDARDLFEWFIARTLAEGWRPGHEVLLVAAIDFFQWNTDRRRLLRFGRVGQSLDESIAERMVFDGLPLPVHARHREVIRLLRRSPRPDDEAQARTHHQDLEWLVQNLPHWLWMIVPAERVNQWRQWGAAQPDSAGTLTGSTGPASSTAVAHSARPSPSAASADAPRKKTSVLSFFLGLMLVLGFLSNAFKRLDNQHDASQSPSSAWQGPALTQADPFESIRTYGNARPSDVLPEPIAPPRHEPASVALPDSPPVTARQLAVLSRAGATAGVCRRAADIAQTHAADAQVGRAPFGPGFDALLAACLDRHRWPRPGDPVLIAALEREATRAQREYQRVLAAPVTPPATTRRTTGNPHEPPLDLDSHLLSVQLEPAAKVKPSPPVQAPEAQAPDPGPGLSRAADRASVLPKVEMPKADYRLSTTPPAPLTAPTPP